MPACARVILVGLRLRGCPGSGAFRVKAGRAPGLPVADAVRTPTTQAGLAGRFILISVGSSPKANPQE